jgi:hypothetical protein
MHHSRAGEWRVVSDGHHRQAAQVDRNKTDHGPMVRDIQACTLKPCSLL